MIFIKIDGEDQHLFQWDKGQRMVVVGADTTYCAEFAFFGDEKSAPSEIFEENGMMYCKVPDSLLTRSGQLICYIRKIGDDQEETVKFARFNVKPMPKPGDYVEPDEILVWHELADRIEALEESGLAGYATEEYVDNKIASIDLPNGFVVQPEAPDDKSLIWIDTDDKIESTPYSWHDLADKPFGVYDDPALSCTIVTDTCYNPERNKIYMLCDFSGTGYFFEYKWAADRINVPNVAQCSYFVSKIKMKQTSKETVHTVDAGSVTLIDTTNYFFTVATYMTYYVILDLSTLTEEYTSDFPTTGLYFKIVSPAYAYSVSAEMQDRSLLREDWISTEIARADDIENSYVSYASEQVLTADQRKQARFNIAEKQYDWRTIDTASGGKVDIADYSVYYSEDSSNKFDIDAAMSVNSTVLDGKSAFYTIAYCVELLLGFDIRNRDKIPTWMGRIIPDYITLKDAGVISDILRICKRNTYNESVLYAYAIATTSVTGYDYAFQILEHDHLTGTIYYNSETSAIKYGISAKNSDDTLTMEHRYADAKAVGEAIAANRQLIPLSSIVTETSTASNGSVAGTADISGLITDNYLTYHFYNDANYSAFKFTCLDWYYILLGQVNYVTLNVISYIDNNNYGFMIRHALGCNRVYVNDGVVTDKQNSIYAYTSSVLTTTNRTEYVPTSDYHPSTKKYTDDAVAQKSQVQIITWEADD